MLYRKFELKINPLTTLFIKKTTGRCRLFAFACLLFLFNSNWIQAQTFSAKNVALYDNFKEPFTQEILIEVKGLPQKTTEDFGLETVEITLQHNRTSDLKIQLQAPDGTTSWVTNRNGGLNGKNYLQTKFSQFGEDGLINTAKNPFTGNYIPDGQFSFFNNSQNPNGIWKLLVEDLKSEEKGFLEEVKITFGNKPATFKRRKICSFETPENCSNQGKTSALLPDLVILPFFTQTQIQEFAKDDRHYPSQLKISVAIANIGAGPLEVFPDPLIMKDVKMDSSKDGNRIPLLQKIYFLKGNLFTSENRKSGTIYYEKMPGHEHYHVDDWIEMRLVNLEKGKRIIVSKGAKVSYCLFTNGMLYENDKASIINNKQYGSDLQNYSLGEYPGCELMKQGIAVGGYDYYGLMYEGQFLTLPKDLNNGKYILEIEIDPDRNYYESNRKNNLFSMPLEITKQ